MSDDSWKQQLRGPAPLGLAIAGTVWVILLLLVLFGEDARQLAASSTSMQVPAAPVTRPFDTRLATGSADLPLDDPRLQRTAATYEPEQISLALAGHQSMFVSWSSGNASFRIAPDAAANEAVETVGAAASQVVIWLLYFPLCMQLYALALDRCCPVSCICMDLDARPAGDAHVYSGLFV